MTGTIRQPCDASNCTVLGRRVKTDSVTWRGLDWSKVRTDNGPHLLHPEASGYLHVGYSHPDEKGLSYWDGVQYRVRYVKRLYSKFKVRGVPVQITSIHAEQVAARHWVWVIGYGPRKESRTA